jgi:hypothetical protein
MILKITNSKAALAVLNELSPGSQMMQTIGEKNLKG